MRINAEKCVGCKKCVVFCPVKAIKTAETAPDSAEGRKVWVDFDECVECYSCFRMAKCPVGALEESPETSSEPRIQRRCFSDPKCDHKSLGFPGRGTEEVKTNDVSGVVKRGYVAFGVEMGRPGRGTIMADVEKVLKALAPMGIHMEPHNALYYLIENHETGELKKQYLKERFLSAIVEFAVSEDMIEKVLETLKKVSKEIDTVFSMDMFGRYHGTELPMMAIMEKQQIKYTPHAKVNLGLGKPFMGE